jgi:hypothetical protein
MNLRFYSIVALFLLLFLIMTVSTVSAGIRVFEEPGVDPAASQEIRTAAELFEGFLKEEMGSSLTQEVGIYICPDHDSYIRVRQREFRETKDVAEKSDKVFGGVWYSSSKFGTIILDLSSPALKTGQDRASSVGRQLFYQAIYQWAGDDFTKKALQWVAEGTADLVGSRVGEKSGFESVEKWKLDRFNTIRAVKNHVSPHDIAQRNPDMWLKYITENKKPAEMADLMVFFLMKQKGFSSIASYFKQLPAGSSEAAFEKTFGMDMGQYLSDFQAWYILSMGEPAQIQFTTQGRVSDEARSYFEKGAELARQLAFDAWNVQMRDAMRVVLTENRDVYVRTMSREFGITPDQAVAEAKNEFWTDRGSVVVMNVSTMKEPEEKVYQIAFVVINRMVAEVAGPSNADNMKWLSYGTASIIAARSAERSGFARYGDFQGAWEYGLSRSNSWAPVMALNTLPNWSAAAEKHGPGAVRGVAALSAHFLADKYGGYPKIGEWLKAVKSSGNPEASFTKTYGMTTAQFWDKARGFVEPYRGGWTAPARGASEATE